jgi:hypothetical protein
MKYSHEHPKIAGLGQLLTDGNKLWIAKKPLNLMIF